MRAVRMTIWKKGGESEPQRITLKGTRGWSLYELQDRSVETRTGYRDFYLRQFFDSILMPRKNPRRRRVRKDVLRVRIEDGEGRWAQWSKRDTLGSLLRNARIVRVDSKGKDTGLEEMSVAMAVAVAEAAVVVAGRAVVVDAIGLEEFPGLVPVLRHLRPELGRKVVLFGRSDFAKNVAGQNGIQYVLERSPDAVAAALSRMSGLEEVTSLGPANLAGPVKIAAGARGLRFMQQLLSVKSFLIGLGTPEDLASELATGLEETLGLGREA